MSGQQSSDRDAFGDLRNFERAIDIISQSDVRSLLTVDENDTEDVHPCGPVTVCEDSFAFAVDQDDKIFWEVLKNPAAYMMCCNTQTGDTVLISGDLEIDLSDSGKAGFLGEIPEMAAAIGKRINSMAICLFSNATATFFNEGRRWCVDLY